MNDPVPAPLPAVPASAVNADLIYAALGDPRRRRILQVLADGQPRTATQLAPVVGKRLDATLKHLVALRKAGLLLMAPDQNDARRQAYALTPHVAVTGTAADGWELDFGCCLVRC